MPATYGTPPRRVAVHQQDLGGGVGRMLMSTVGTLIAPMRMSSLCAWVLRENTPARRFYESLGGVLFREQNITIGRQTLREVAYLWEDVEWVLTSG